MVARRERNTHQVNNSVHSVDVRESNLMGQASGWLLVDLAVGCSAAGCYIVGIVAAIGDLL